MVIYGVTADVSIGRLFMAGVVPGVLMGVRFDGDGGLRGRVARASAANPSPASGPSAGHFWTVSLRLMTPLVILGGMFSGLFTPTEAAAMALPLRVVPGLCGVPDAVVAADCRPNPDRDAPKPPAWCWCW
jgi:TRAP-type C4-dicarboxylate transport system permease large subunit